VHFPSIGVIGGVMGGIDRIHLSPLAGKACSSSSASVLMSRKFEK
jgi:hypothetical protein